MKKQFDISTAKKIISEYADKINFYMKQNELLKGQMDDITTTLNINKNILYNQLLDNPGCIDYASVINQLKNENERISERNSKLNLEKEAIESKVKNLKNFILDFIKEKIILFI
jgi:chaperonin cofactor prefoldin